MGWIVALMLSTAIGAPRQDAAALAANQFGSVVAGLGYQLTLPRQTLQRDGLTVQCGLAYGYEKAKMTGISSIDLIKSFTIPDAVADDAVDRWVDSNDPGHLWVCRIHLDHSISAKSEIAIELGPSLSATRSRLDDAWAWMQRLQAWLALPQNQAKTRHRRENIESLVVQRLDAQDVSFLVRRWKWDYKHSWGASSPTWLLPAVINGTTIWFRGPIGGGKTVFSDPPDDHFQVTCEFDLSKPLTSDQLQTQIGKPNPWAKFSLTGSSTRVSAIKSIDLTGGIRIGDLKTEILEFESQVKQLAGKA